MQTFLPIATTDFSQMAKFLDNKRLNKQALEGWQILLTLLELDPVGNPRTPKGWVNHPAVKLWRGHELQLFAYVISMTNEWIDRGFKTTIGEKAMRTIATAVIVAPREWTDQLPQWAQDSLKFEAMASSHRKALLSKDYEWYSQFNWAEDVGSRPETYEYIWE
jgi:hypothetical protein